ncbi:glycosyltransferase family 2 protein [Streptomyces sp. H27-D2]|uniref:glycosyltransferase family 2 protein n=1 Tax=Streptomyces sp. H27-D2 TaxID=3046304 RepID=UPI002DBE0A2C|nr:glycosyltransferase family 2 protein [Streptomyces sp. H27-D2]MEC4019634.1 glycosyltransferase family 2 protein [Streptomyces sp. H27-D2]
MSCPRVSVIIAAYNAMPELTRSVTSAMEQTLGLAKLEIIAVDDGSTDGTAAELDRLAAGCRALRVIRQENSGGAGGPRNTGLDVARGDYVFFLDADDYLGPDALRRMVAMADENHTDVVLGKLASPDKRGVPRAVFQANQPRTDVFSSHAYSTLGPWKLFRRSLIERLNLRFPPCRNGEDKPFTAAAYINADGISVVADYDCYHICYRDDRSNLTLTGAGLVDRMESMRLMFETVARYVEPGPRRDKLMRRHIQWELCGALRALVREDETDARERFFPAFKEWADAHCGDELFTLLNAPERLMIHLLRTDRFDELLTVVREAKADAKRGHRVEGGRVYWLHPYFRSPEVAVPDVCFDVTDRLPVHHHLDEAAWSGSVLRLAGHAYIEHVDTAEDPAAPDTPAAPAAPEARTAVILHRRGEGTKIRVPVTALAEHGFTVDLDLATAADGGPLERGIWDLSLDVRAQGVSRTVRFGRRRADGVDTSKPRRIVRTGPERGTVVTPYFTRPEGDFSLDVGEVYHRLDAPCRITRTDWHPAERGTLTVTGRLHAASLPAGALLLRAEDRSGTAHDLPVRYEPDALSSEFTALLALHRLPKRRWRLSLVLDGLGDGLRHSVPVPPPERHPDARWYRPDRPDYTRRLRAHSRLRRWASTPTDSPLRARLRPLLGPLARPLLRRLRAH